MTAGDELAAQADERERLRTATTTFVGPVEHSDVEIDVAVLRRGRRLSHVRAEVRTPGAQAGHVTTAIYGEARAGFEFADLRPPAARRPPFRPSRTLDPLALVALGDTTPGAVREAIGSGHQGWFPPSLDLTVQPLAECRSEWVLGDHRARRRLRVSGDGDGGQGRRRRAFVD